MFLRFALRIMFCKQGRFAIFLGFLNVFVCLSIYYCTLPQRMLRHEPQLPRFKKGNGTTGIHDNIHSTNHSNLQGPYGDIKIEGETLAMNSKLRSENNVTELSLMMNGCPVDWPHEVLRHDSTGMPAAQVCRSKRGGGHWRCAKGWKSLRHDPFCIKVPTQPITDLFVGSVKGDYEDQTPRQFLAEKLKLLFHQLPGTVVEISPSIFHVLRKNESFDRSLLEHYHKFTVIMHPCFRLIKVWEVILDLKVNVSFTSFLNGRLSPWKPLLLFDKKRLTPQAEMLFDDHRQVWLDQFLVLERWNESLSELMRGANVDAKSTKLLRAISANSEQCRLLYTQETWLKMTNSYAMDFCVFQYSTNINETHIMPQLDLTMQTLTSRYNACRQKATDMHTSSLVIPSQSIVTLPNPCTMHTYYQPAYDNPTDILANQNVLNLWKKAWAFAGWQTRVLNESDAMLHSDYEYLKEKFLSFPTVNQIRYTYGNFLRHVAMATVGGGWMSDYDMLPLHFPPCSTIPFNGSYTVWSGFVPALVSAHGNDYTRVAHLMADVGLQWRARPDPFLELDGRPQVSDMKTLFVLVREGHVKCFEVIIETSDYSHGGFACNKTKRFLTSYYSRYYPEGMPLSPWGVHLSHAFMSFMRNRNITLWPGLSWETQKADPSPFFRETFMKYVYNIYLEKCDLETMEVFH